MNKITGVTTNRIVFLVIFFIYISYGLTMGQDPIKSKPDYSLTKADNMVMAIIHEIFPIDKKTFQNTTPDRNNPYWIHSLRRYQAMDKDWLACDPPGPPEIFIVTPSNKVFRSMSQALTSIKYVPRDDKDALRTAVMIAGASAPFKGKIITSNTEKVEGVPENILAGHIIVPSVIRNGQKYSIILFSYVSTKTENKFIRGFHAFWKHMITIEGYTYKEKITILWEKL